MGKMETKGLGGLILSSPNPERLAKFYRDVIGIPFELRSHGNLPQHWECDFDEVHFAILKQREKGKGTNTVVPSFVVDDIREFIKTHHLELLHPIMDLGEGSFVATTNDIDGNVIRLWTNKDIRN